MLCRFLFVLFTFCTVMIEPKKLKYNIKLAGGKLGRVPGNEAERFWSKIKLKENGCWDFSSNQDKNGYGRFKCGSKGMWKNRRAHRIMYEKIHGEIPTGLLILHSCDNPSCVNPLHLSAGTAKENTHDMISRGRRGCGNAKLSNQNVIEIKTQLSNGVPSNDVANSFGVNPTTIGLIKNGRSWKHLQ